MSSAVGGTLLEKTQVTGANVSVAQKSMNTLVSETDYVFTLTVTSYVAGTITGKIQTSYDDGANWHDCATFGNLTADGQLAVEPTIKIGTNIRAVLTSSAGTDAVVSFGRNCRLAAPK